MVRVTIQAEPVKFYGFYQIMVIWCLLNYMQKHMPYCNLAQDWQSVALLCVLIIVINFKAREFEELKTQKQLPNTKE